MRSVLAAAHRILLILAAVALLAAPASAAGSEDDPELDALFAQLKVASDAASADAIAQRIWTIWTNPADPELAGRMYEALAARSMGGISLTLRLLDTIVADYPDYAEGWNQRATMRYLNGDYEGSLEDIEKVLEFEPRHFGALSGRVLIYLAQGRRGDALREMAAALAIHPFLNERHLFPELEEEMVRI